jgi:hypothetical protein
MTYLLALVAAIGGALLGFFLGAGAGSVLATALGVSSFEGASGYFAIAIGLLGGLIGLLTGGTLMLRRRGHRGFGAMGGRLILVLAGLAALVFAGVQIRLATLENFPGGLNPQLHFEIRLPAGAPEPNRRLLDFEMQAGSQRSGGLLKDEWLRRDGERLVLSGFVPLYTRTAQRVLVMSQGDGPKVAFLIRLSATPKVSEQFGEWQAGGMVLTSPPESQPHATTGPDARYEIRYRVPDWTK